MLVKEQGLPLADHTQHAVVQQQDHHGHPVDHGGGHFIQVHAKAAVAGDQNGPFAGTHGGADGGAHAEAHGTQAAAGDKPAACLQVQILSCPHLVLAHVGGHGGVGAQVAVQGGDDVAGRHALPAVQAGRFLLPELRDLRLPLRMLRPVQQRQELLKGLLHVAPETVGGMHRLAQLRSVDVNVDDFGGAGEFGPVAGDPVIEPGAHGDDHVGVVHGHGTGVVAVHTLHSQEPGIVRGNTGNAHQGAAHGGVDDLSHLQQFLLGVAGDQTAAEVEEGPLGGVDAVRRLPDADVLCRMGFLRRHRGLGFVVIFGHLHILGHVDEYGTGTAGFRQPEGFPDGIRQILDGTDEIVVLGNGQGDTGDIDLLEAVGADDGVGHVAGDGYQGNGVDVSRGDAGDQVGGAGAGGGDDHAHVTGGPGIAVGGMGGPLLVGGQHMLQLALVFVQGVIDVDDLAAGVAEDHIGALLDQSAHDDIRAGKYHVIILSCILGNGSGLRNSFSDAAAPKASP